jgi:hypothetical protein
MHVREELQLQLAQSSACACTPSRSSWLKAIGEIELTEWINSGSPRCASTANTGLILDEETSKVTKELPNICVDCCSRVFVIRFFSFSSLPVAKSCASS